MKKVIYLDFDGVINDGNTPCIEMLATYGVKNYHTGICPDLIERVNKIAELAEGDVEVWVHSSWRESYSSEQLIKLLAENGMTVPVKGNVPMQSKRMDGGYSSRGLDIRAHIECFGVKKYVILDDLGPSFFEFEDRQNLVKTNEMAGIQDSDVEKAVNILNA